MSIQPVLMWEEQDVCPYSNLFFSGLRMIATRPASMIVPPSAPSPIEPESSKAAGKRPAHIRNGSYPQRDHPAPRAAYPRINTDKQTLDRRVRSPGNEHSTSSRHADGLHGRAKSRREAFPSFSSSSDRPVSHDSDGESIASSYNDIEYITSPLNSFFSFNPSPTDSTVSLVSPRRERRSSLESTKTVPLPPKRTSRADKRRSMMSVDIRPPSPARGREAAQANANARGARSSVGGWADEVLRDWRQRVDSHPESQDDRSFLITS
ncbi:uncharacterized protein B0H18DRAFT_953335 [Fomitopsis serialis]|uniref:uncharacterized protein n=1 Tax=Fomitopsis serialis TaxID=139415 RepID=UPI00200841D3|nr:uncharacterized protein B0H18DRAFT_953335 [Neoantrodia serialis]KAH9930071.1 hypothetical protein B0H18DRAFT_953335 [Neoantrodia serialis]